MGLIGKTIDWLDHPEYSNSTPLDWFAGLVIVFLIGMLWSKVLRGLLRGDAL